MNAGIYCRISEDREGAGLGIERQREDCEALAMERGWEVVGTYADNDISAYSGKTRRPEYRRLLTDVQAGRIDVIVAWHTDRLHRSPRELEEFIDVCDAHKIRVETVRAGELDLRTPAGRAVARTLGAWARYESEHKSERIRRKQAELAQRGLPYGGGLRCYGYTKDRMNLVAEEAVIIREMADRVLAGETIWSVSHDLNQRGLVTTTGGRWTDTGVRKILLSPRMAGLIQHATVGRVRAQWPAILTEEQHTRLVALLTDPSRRTPRGAPRRHLLSGLLRCGECGERMVAAKRRDNHSLHYTCQKRPDRGCGRMSVAAHHVEPYVADAVLAALEDLRIDVDGRPNSEEGDLEALANDRAQLDELAELYATRAITAEEWIRARSSIEERIAQRNRRIADKTEDQRLRDLLRSNVGVREAWTAATTEYKRSVLRVVLDRVTVAKAIPGKRFDPRRLTPVWRV